MWDAVCGRELSYYPRQEGKTLEVATVLDLIQRQLGDLSFDSADNAKSFIDRAKESLEEVKKHTEYQDQKVSRLLTIVAFLTAAAGTIFGKVVDAYPLHPNVQTPDLAAFLVGSTYALFAAYLVLVACGALVTFHATQTRFVWPAGREDARAESVKSFLFYQSILTTRPEVWAKAFIDPSNSTKPSPSMLAGYYRNYVAEAYLVAAKVGDKLRHLQPAQRILLRALRVLLAWFLVSAATFALLPSSGKVKESRDDSSARGTQKTVISPTAVRQQAPTTSTPPSSIAVPTTRSGAATDSTKGAK